MSELANSRQDAWPSLPLEAWQETYATLHMWTQIVGKVRMAQSPWVNHSWHVTLYVTTRGLTTSPIPHGTPIGQSNYVFDPTSGKVILCLLGSYPSSLPSRANSRPGAGPILAPVPEDFKLRGAGPAWNGEPSRATGIPHPWHRGCHQRCRAGDYASANVKAEGSAGVSGGGRVGRPRHSRMERMASGV